MNSAADLANWRAELNLANDASRPCVSVCGGTGCRVYGSEKVWKALRDEIARRGFDAALKYEVKVTGCHGFCEKGPLVVMRPQGIMYTHVRVGDVSQIVEETLIGGRTVERLLYADPASGARIERERDVPFYKNQHRVILDLNGDLDPTQIREYVAHGGYASLAHALTSMAPEQVVAEIKASGLRGRGGAGFPTGVKLGGGAFVCGEETALMASIEGNVGEPRTRPPYPAESGLWGKPTNINNVKSWASVPVIIEKGADWYAHIGTPTSKGTMIFSVVGKVNNTGLVEVPMGISLRELIFDIAGGVPNGKRFKAAQIGGPSGGCIPAEHLDAPIDYESLKSLGAIVGSGGLVVADETTCMVDFALYFMTFTQEESCGKCVPCRVGTRVMLTILERICAGNGQPRDLDYLLTLGESIKLASLCGLGQTAPNPVLSTIRYFREEYEAHIFEKRCPAKVCKGLITFSVIPDKCSGCMVCLRNCTANAVAGTKLQVHWIDATKCTRCGMCASVCKFDAIAVS